MTVTKSQIFKEAHSRAAMRCDINPAISYRKAFSDALRFAWSVARQCRATAAGVVSTVLRQMVYGAPSLERFPVGPAVDTGKRVRSTVLDASSVDFAML